MTVEAPVEAVPPPAEPPANCGGSASGADAASAAANGPPAAAASEPVAAEEDAAASAAPSSPPAAPAATPDAATAAATVAATAVAAERDAALLRASESDRRLAALLEAVGLVGRIAAMDPGTYREGSAAAAATAPGGGAGAPAAVDGEGCDVGGNGGGGELLPSIQRRIDALHLSSPSLTSSPVQNLLESVHRLQSSLILVRSEADAATDEIQSVQRSLAKSRSRVRRLERAVAGLYGQNEELRDRLARKRQKSRALVRNVKDAVAGMKVRGRREEEREREVREVADRIAAHESVMRRRRRRSGGGRDDDGGGGAATGSAGADGTAEVAAAATPPSSRSTGERERTYTADSHSSLYSDLDDSVDPPQGHHYDYDFDACEVSTVGSDDYYCYGTTEDDRSTASSSVLSWESTSSAPLVTDGGGATVTLEPKRTVSFPPPPSYFGDGGGGSPFASFSSSSSTAALQRVRDALEEDEGGRAPAAACCYELTFPAGRKVGIQFQKVPLEGRGGDEAEDPGRQQPAAIAAADNDGGRPSQGPSSSTLAAAAADVSSDLKALGSLLNGVLTKGGGESGSGGGGAGTRPAIALGGCGGDGGDGAAATTPDCAFLVCGFSGFDCVLNVRPTIGARLVAIDGESLERGAWTFKRLRTTMQAAGGPGGAAGSSSGRTFTMKFRNDPLTRRQKEILDRAVVAAEKREADASRGELSGAPEEAGGGGGGGGGDSTNQTPGKQVLFDTKDSMEKTLSKLTSMSKAKGSSPVPSTNDNTSKSARTGGGSSEGRASMIESAAEKSLLIGNDENIAVTMKAMSRKLKSLF